MITKKAPLFLNMGKHLTYSQITIIAIIKLQIYKCIHINTDFKVN